MKRAEPYLQHDTTSKWDVLTFFAATFAISRSSDIDIGRQDGGAAMEEGGVKVLIPVRFEAYSGYVILMKTLRGTIATI